ncbi:uncharacterized protein N7477_002019 [Penicillium maclennaniae]|uniref:uncharacterized protein n=1 Tax=Penicillium maclennaniae TaxID=1343394 RepID=UPI0025426158|nr:uncharacterized protein N7477_002019 [Penicillium maclennaniae]KAJ5682079.1 hypothetical protein N7477_002019 [Penicillium maclennaniae]
MLSIPTADAQIRAYIPGSATETGPKSTTQRQEGLGQPGITGQSVFAPSLSATSTSDVEVAGTYTSSEIANAGISTEAAATSITSTVDQTLTSTSALASATSTSESANAESDGLASTSKSTQNRLAIALPIAIIGLLAVAGVLFFYMRRRRQRNAQPAYGVPVSQSKGMPASKLMVVPAIVTTGSTPRFSALGVPTNLTRDSSSGSSTVRSPDEANMELGIAVSISRDPRMSATEQNLYDMTQASSNEIVRSHLHSPSRNQHDDEAVSVISGLDERRAHEEDFDDMSSVSSFNDDSTHDGLHRYSFR